MLDGDSDAILSRRIVRAGVIVLGGIAVLILARCVAYLGGFRRGGLFLYSIAVYPSRWRSSVM